MVFSLLLIAVAVVLLAAGLWQPSAALLSGSIAASLLAAITLVAGARRGVVAQPAEGPAASPTRPRRRALATAPRHLSVEPGSGDSGPGDVDVAPVDQPEGSASAPVAEHRSTGAAPEPMTVVIPTQGGAARQGGAGQSDAEVDPPDEPAPQQVSAADAARVGQMTAEVLVVDGRPRYHLPGCVHLLGRDHEPIPVSEAITLGFTPCSLCEPDSALLADARRV